MPETPPPFPPARHRWFQFRLRTLLIAVAVLAVPCAWVSYSLKWIEDRDRMIRDHAVGGYTHDVIDLNKAFMVAPGGLWLLGESPQDVLKVEPGYGDEARRLFPEALISEAKED